jgi:DnaK suppressor protein
MHMAAEQTALRQRLDEEKARVLRELETIHSSSPAQSASAFSEDGGHRTSTSADAIRTVELEKSLALEQTLRALLGEVEHALQKMADGTYGFCDDCGKPIAAARLEALPWANLCIDDKSKRDGKGRLRR